MRPYQRKLSSRDASTESVETFFQRLTPFLRVSRAKLSGHDRGRKGQEHWPENRHRCFHRREIRRIPLNLGWTTLMTFDDQRLKSTASRLGSCVKSRNTWYKLFWTLSVGQNHMLRTPTTRHSSNHSQPKEAARV